MKFVAGFDGGGSSCRALVVELSGRACGLGRAGPASVSSQPVSAAREQLMRALNSAWQAAGVAPQPLAGAFLGLAGFSAAPANALEQLTCGLPLEAEAVVEADHDLRIAHAGALQGTPGIVLIAGTGSACFGRDGHGASHRAGGWGWLAGDEGSGYDLGRQALIAALRDWDGRGPATTLRDRLCVALGLADPARITQRLYQPLMERAEVAALAIHVVQAAEEGDAVAAQLIDSGAQGLVDAVTAVERALRWSEEIPLALAGTLALSQSYQLRIQKALSNAGSLCAMRPASLSPVAGAALLAAQRATAALPPAFFARLSAASA
jgi:glucosamine kinase